MNTSKMSRIAAAAVASSGLLATPVAAAAPTPAPALRTVVHERVSIDMGGGWTARGELSYPRTARGRLPVVVLLHGSGHNDMNQTLPDGKGSTFLPITRVANAQGFAVLRFNKRGITGVGPVVGDDAAQLAPDKPYQRIVEDAAAVVRFAATSPRVDPARIYLLGHSEGTQVASNLAADPKAYAIPKPAGVIEMGVVGIEVKQLISFQVFGVKLVRLHDESDIDGDGTLTYREAADGLIGLPKATAAAYRDVLLKGRRINPTTDRNNDGRLSIDNEVGPVFSRLSGVGNYPALTGVDQATRDYLVDIARFPTVSQDLPRYSGPVLLLNGENDIQTPARAAIVADAALTAARHRDHTLVTYPGLAHTMNRTTKFTPAFGPPDAIVLADIGRWLAAHR